MEEACLSFVFKDFYFHSLIDMHLHPTATLPNSSQRSSLFSHTGILHLLLHVEYQCSISLFPYMYIAISRFLISVFSCDLFIFLNIGNVFLGVGG